MVQVDTFRGVKERRDRIDRENAEWRTHMIEYHRQHIQSLVRIANTLDRIAELDSGTR